MSIKERALYGHLAEQIRDHRERLKITQKELADMVEVSRTSINNIEKRRQKPPLHLVYRIAEALKLDVVDLLPTQREVTEEGLVTVKVGGEIRAVPPKAAEALKRATSDLDQGG